MFTMFFKNSPVISTKKYKIEVRQLITTDYNDSTD